MQAQRNYQNQQGGTSMAGLLGRPRVPPADAFRAFRESEGLPPVRGATPREDDRTPTPEPPEDDDQPETPPQSEELQLVTQQPLLDPESPYDPEAVPGTPVSGETTEEWHDRPQQAPPQPPQPQPPQQQQDQHQQ